MTERLHDLGQSPRLGNITRDRLRSGTLKHYIDEPSVTYPTTVIRIGWHEEWL